MLNLLSSSSPRSRQCLLLLLPLFGALASHAPTVSGARSALKQPSGSHGHVGTYLRSNNIGITHCQLPSNVGGQQATLHLWMRYTPPWAIPGQPKTGKQAGSFKGFAFLQARQSVPKPSFIPLLRQAENLVPKLKLSVSLKAHGASERYPLDVSKELPINGRVIDITGAPKLSEAEAATLDWEVRVEGFRWYCVLDSSPSTITAAWDQQQQQQQQGRSKGRPPAFTWQHVTKTSISQDTRVVFLLSPFFDLDIKHYATLLWHHVLWHTQLGISHYLLYVTERVTELVEEPLIQELQRQGVLQVVLYQDVPRYEHTSKQFHAQLFNKYLSQVLVYNHGVLSVWGSDSLVMVADLDEYLTSARPMSAVQMYKECGTGKQDVGLLVWRVNAVCRPDVQQCGGNNSYWALWRDTSPAAVASGKTDHPMTFLTAEAINMSYEYNVKSYVDPNQVTDVHIHAFRVRKRRGGSTKRPIAEHQCARLLHLFNLLSDRTSAPQDNLVTEEERQGWWWPLSAVSKAAAGRSLDTWME